MERQSSEYQLVSLGCDDFGWNAAMTKPGSILYIASRLPCRSETFVYREVLALRGLGVRIITASLRRPETGLGDAQLERLAAESIIVYASFFQCIADLLREFALTPKRTTQTFISAFQDSLDGKEGRAGSVLKTLIQAAAGISLALRIRGRGVTRIHCHMAHAPATVGMYAAMQCRIPFSFTGHGADVFRDRSLLKQKLSRAIQVMCISDWHRAVYQRIHERLASEYPLVRCGVDTNAFRPDLRAELSGVDEQQSSPMILTVARLVPKKGVHLLVQALSCLQRAGLKFRAVIAGAGPELERVQTLARQLGLSGCIEWMGAITHADVTALMREADVFVLPCVIAPDGDRDGIPVVLMEAMAAGVPCVSSDFSAVRELIEDGISGRLVAPADVKGFARAIKSLMFDSEQRTTIRLNAFERVQSEFSTDLNARRLLSAFQPDYETVV